MKKIVMAVAIALVAAPFASATTFTNGDITITQTSRPVTLLESGDGAPAGGTVYDYTLTTTGDVLAFNFVTTDPAAYQNGAGSDNEPPNPLFVPFFPALAADSWITTPGSTAVLGGGFPANGDDTWGDTDSNGAQVAFPAARITLPAGAAGAPIFAGRIDAVDANGDLTQLPFSFAIPEPTTVGLAAFGLVGLALRRRNG